MTAVILILCIIAFLLAPELWIMLAVLALRTVFSLLVIGLALALLIGLVSDAPYMLAGSVLAVACLSCMGRFVERFEGADDERRAAVPASTATLFYRCATMVATLGGYTVIFAGLLSCIFFFALGLVLVVIGIRMPEGGAAVAGLVSLAGGGFGTRYFWRVLFTSRAHIDQHSAVSGVVNL